MLFLMDLMVLSRSYLIKHYEVEGKISSVVMEDLGPDFVFVEGDIARNKDWSGLKSDLSDRGLLGYL